MSDLVLVDTRGATAVRHPVGPDMSIGRSRRCDLELDVRGVARRHAAIEHFASGFAIRDLGSRAGVWVNHKRISSPHTLAPGDVLWVGPVTLRVERAEETEPAREPAAEVEPALEPRPEAPPPPPEPVPATVSERLGAAAEGPLEFPRAGRRSRRSVATSGAATAFCFAVLAADAVALAFYLASN